MMVLKKSNSRLNSGATQRVAEGGTLKLFKLSWYSEQIIFLKVNVAYGEKKQTDSLAECLHKIWDRLGWIGPDMFLTFRHKLNISRGQTWAELGWFSTNKRKTWLLPNRILAMMSDTEYLKDILPLLDINVSEHTEVRTGRKSLIKTHRLSQIVSDVPSTKKCKDSRRRQTGHNRGIQRPYLFRRQSKTKENVENVFTKPSNVLEVEIYHPYQVDARCANKNDVNRFTKKKYCEKTTKSRLKCKGHVNGRYAELKGYTRHDIMEETQLALCDQTKQYEEDLCHFPGNYHNNKETHFSSVSLCDFVVQNRPQTKRCKKRKYKQEVQSEVKEFVKYPKGSFQYIHKDVDQSESLSKSTWEMLEESLPPNSSNNEEQDDIGYASHTDKDDFVISTPENVNLYEKEIGDFDQSFIDVALVLFNDDVNVTENQEMNVDGHNVVIGKCYPPAFIVDISPSDKVSDECFLLVKKKDLNSSLWNVAFQCVNYCEVNFKLQSILFEEWTCCLKLSRLIELATSIRKETQSCSRPETCDDNLVASSKCGINSSDTIIFGPAEKVFSLVPTETKHKAPDCVNTVLTETNTDIQGNECPVCLLPFHVHKCPAMKLLPCGHTFCVRCWQTQIVFEMQRGVNQCTCLAVKCQNIIDKTTMLTLLPLDIVSRWHRQKLERSVEVSQFCNWCPRDRCQNLAVSLSTPLKTQFGQPLTCICGHSWCGSCKNTPHWPVSCDQMTAYKKLMSKVGLNKDLAYDTIYFHIKLKPCPQCKYPIEKNNGCPVMTCRMCNYYFCWNCLKCCSFHNVYTCPNNDDNYVTYSLQNKLVHDLPLKYFTKCIQARRQTQTLTLEGQKWLQYYKHPLPNDRIVKVKSFTSRSQVDVTLILDDVEQCLDFLVRYYKFQELFYFLLDFAQMKNSNTRQLAARITAQCSQLHFVAWRLQENILGKPANYFYNRRKLSKSLLSTGERLLKPLKQLVPYFQHMSKDIDTKPIGDIDVLQYLRYK
uniref:RBR-type E3 ubiquitin transferase n=1 Tax=Biomphalaria glabrata TaxID=6526 RepID=A0A2C9KJH1_BIOGL